MQAASPDTPPVDVIASEAGLLAHGSTRRSGLPKGKPPVTLIDRRSPLTVAGAAPALAPKGPHRLPVLASARANPSEEPRHGPYLAASESRQVRYKDFFICLFRPKAGRDRAKVGPNLFTRRRGGAEEKGIRAEAQRALRWLARLCQQPFNVRCKLQCQVQAKARCRARSLRASAPPRENFIAPPPALGSFGSAVRRVQP